MINLYSIIKKPIMTEKASSFFKTNKISLEVHRYSSKRQINLALKRIFKINALSINTMITRGKVKHVGKAWGKTKNIKKAIITVSNETNMDNIFVNHMTDK